MSFIDKTLEILESNSDLSISIDDIEPTKAAIKYAKKVKKLMDSGKSYKDAFQEVTKTKIKPSGALETRVINYLKSIGVDVKHF